MHATAHAKPLGTQRDNDLQRLLLRFRWRLGFERALVFGLRGLVLGAVTLVGVSIVTWLSGLTIDDAPGWLVATPLALALGIAVVRWPTRRQAALAADRRLGLAERLVTALELVDGHPAGRFDHLQIRDAVGRAQAAPFAWLLLDRRVRAEALLAVTLVLVAAASLLLPQLPRPFSEADRSAAVTDLAALPDMAERALPLDENLQDQTLANAQPAQQTQADADLATRVQQEQGERSALDGLARALGSVSAGQAAADAIEQGNFANARDQLQGLGEEADQLSDAAKQQLAKALQQAATTTAQTDRQLADRERQAAQALSRATYADQRQALRGLADQVERSGARSVPSDQLERDIGRLQQQAGAGQPNAGVNPAPAGGPGGSAEGQLGGPGVGTGTDPDVLGSQPSRLDNSGTRVQVPTKLGTGPGVRPADGTEDQTGADSTIGARSVSELARAQQTGQVAPEQNLVPGELRPVVRGYFR